jgi:glycosyltransferase involved in cell wall biosynthesis
MAQCLRTGLDLELTLVGAGRYRSQLEAQALRLGLEAHTRFRGQIARREDMWAELDQADLFVLPSRQEGLPRAMLEAMARALPAIGSTAGGIPELLPQEDLAPIGDAAALANRIREVLLNPDRLAAMSARNLVKAQDFREEVMRRRRNQFLHDLRGRTQEWMRRQES